MSVPAITITVAAITRGHAVVASPCRLRRAICTVRTRSSLVTRRGHRYVFHVVMNVNTARVASMGRFRGSTVETKNRNLEAPSTCIASCRSFGRSEEHTSELQSRGHLVCRLLLEKKKHNGERHAGLTAATEHYQRRPPLLEHIRWRSVPIRGHI